MSSASTIEWTTSTWNPVTGCQKVSPGCDHCYAETFAERFRGVAGHSYEQGFDLKLHPSRLELPLRWSRSRRIFVNSMSDLFHADVPEEYIRRVFDIMARAHWHTFQVLTKRAERMKRIVCRLLAPPSSNVWLGVSVETPVYYSRIRHLLGTPAAVRFVSCEPLLTPLPELPLNGIDWVIIGGESGHRPRPMDPLWARDILQQCRRAGVAPFMKQLGTVAARSMGMRSRKGVDIDEWHPDLRVREFPLPPDPRHMSKMSAAR